MLCLWKRRNCVHMCVVFKILLRVSLSLSVSYESNKHAHTRASEKNRQNCVLGSIECRELRIEHLAHPNREGIKKSNKTRTHSALWAREEKPKSWKFHIYSRKVSCARFLVWCCSASSLSSSRGTNAIVLENLLLHRKKKHWSSVY